MNPVHSSLLVLSVASPFLLPVAHFHGISSSPASFMIVLLSTAEKNKSTRPKYGFVELRTARTDSGREGNPRASSSDDSPADDETELRQSSWGSAYFINRS